MEPTVARQSYLPFPNMSIFRLMRWFYDTSLTKSLGTLKDLVHQVLLAPDFNTNYLIGFDAAKEAKRLDDFHPSAPEESTSQSTSPSESLGDGWIEASVPISLPRDGVSHPSDATAPVFHVKGLVYRKPLEVIKIQGRISRTFSLAISSLSIRRILETLPEFASRTNIF